MSKNEISNLWRIKPVNQDSVLELRAIKQKGVVSKLFRGRDYPSVEQLCLAFEDEALRLNRIGYNIYVVMNEINPEFDGKSASDNDILYRTLLLIDIDRVKSTNPATDIEVNEAYLMASKVAEYLKHSGWPDPILVMSGNGYHLYYQMESVPNDDESRNMIQAFLKGLAKKFNNKIVEIDTSVFNASRITKVVGSIARKGEESADRPYRMAYLV